MNEICFVDLKSKQIIMTTVTLNYKKYWYSEIMTLKGTGKTKQEAMINIRILNPFLTYLELFEIPNYKFTINVV